MKKFLLYTENYALSLLTKKLNKDHLFHNVAKTQQVVNSVKELIKGEKISEVEGNILLFAAWFHNLGFANRTENYIEASVNTATTFLEEYNIDNTIIDDVVRLIRITKTDEEAQDILEKILKDAVSFYYTETSFIDKNELLKQELKLLFNTDYSELEWVQKNINTFVKEHRFHTKYAQENWQNGKDKNLAILVKIEKQLLNEKSTENNLEISFKKHHSLTEKALSILVVNSLILFLSIAGYYAINNTIVNQNELPSLLVFLFFNLISVLLALISARPLHIEQELKEEVLNQQINFKRKLLKYIYVVFFIGVISSVLIFFLGV